MKYTEPEVASVFCEGRVLAVENCRFTIVADDEVASASRAAGCLLQPCAGDVVLLYRRAQGAFCILNVLEREGGCDAELALESPARITCAGPLTIAAPTIRSEAASMQFTAESLKLDAQKADVAVGALTFLAQKVDAAILLLLQKLGRSSRRVETTEEVHAAQIHLKADEILQAESKYTVMISDEITRIDGKQIQMG